MIDPEEKIASLKPVLDAASEVIFGIASDGSVILWNLAAERFFGTVQSGKMITEFIPRCTGEELQSAHTTKNSRQTLRSSVSIYNKRKELRSGFFVAYKVHIPDTLIQYVVVFSDNTDEVRVYDEIQKTESWILRVLEGSQEILFTFDSRGYILWGNSAANASLRLFRKKKASLFTIFQQLEIQSVTALPVSEAKEYDIIALDGTELRVKGVFKIPDETAPSGAQGYGLFTDVTQSIILQRELRLMEAIFESSSDAIAVSLQGKLVLMNGSFLQLFGYQSDKELEENPFQIFEEGEIRVGLEASGAHPREMRGSSSIVDCVAHKKDGTTFFAEVTTSSFSFRGDQFFVLSIRDITEKKRNQEAIRHSEERYRTLSDNIQDFLWSAENVDGQLRIVFITSAVTAITGYSREEFLGDSTMFYRIVNPDDLPVLKTNLRTLFGKTRRKTDEIELRIIHSQGHSVWIRNKLTLIRDQKGKVQKVFGLVSDISLQKKAEEELKSSAEGLRKLNEAKDRFMSIISHDLRTPFSSILGFTDLLLAHPNRLSDDEKRQYVQYIQESSRNMLNLVNSLLDWTRIQTGRIPFAPSKSNLSTIIGRSVKMISGAGLQKNIRILEEIPYDLFVFVDQNLVLQAVNNLLSNAVKFTNPGGTITIGCAAAESPRFIEFFVKDTGIGIKKQDIHKVFKVEEKFTTPGTGGEKGSGLGLSLVKEIIEKHGGDIRVVSEPGQGTTFFATLPKASSSMLYVDKSTQDRVLYAKIMKSIFPDYEIDTAASAEEALSKIAEIPYVVIVTGHNLPDMPGYRFVEELRKQQDGRNISVIVLTSSISSEDRYEYERTELKYIFQKPVELSAFKEAIESAVKKTMQTS